MEFILTKEEVQAMINTNHRIIKEVEKKYFTGIRVAKTKRFRAGEEIINIGSEKNKKLIVNERINSRGRYWELKELISSYNDLKMDIDSFRIVLDKKYNSWNNGIFKLYINNIYTEFKLNKEDHEELKKLHELNRNRSTRRIDKLQFLSTPMAMLKELKTVRTTSLMPLESDAKRIKRNFNNWKEILNVLMKAQQRIYTERITKAFEEEVKEMENEDAN